MITCILYGYIIYYGLFNESFHVPAPMAFKSCIECEKTKDFNIIKLQKGKNVKDVNLNCKAMEINEKTDIW